jgi:hypothetical protein
MLTYITVLDPQIKFDGLMLKAESDEDEDYKKHILEMKTALAMCFDNKYMKVPITPQANSSAPKGSLPTGCQCIDFTSHYHHRSELLSVDELNEYFHMRCEPWDICNPIHWWGNHASQFPHLSHLARDIFSIPGKNCVFHLYTFVFLTHIY